MRRTATITAAVLLGASLLAGCGSDDGDKKASGGSSDSYCDQLKDKADDIKSFTADNAEPDFTKFDEFLDNAEELADAAPAEISDDWDTMLGAMNKLLDALDDAGIKPEDLDKIIAGEMPDGVDMAKLQALGTELQELGTEKVTAAGEAISKYAKDKCGVDLDAVS